MATYPQALRTMMTPEQQRLQELQAQARMTPMGGQPQQPTPQAALRGPMPTEADQMAFQKAARAQALRDFEEQRNSGRGLLGLARYGIDSFNKKKRLAEMEEMYTGENEAKWLAERNEAMNKAASGGDGYYAGTTFEYTDPVTGETGYRVGQLPRGPGEIRWPELPEGTRALPSAGIAGFDPSMIRERDRAELIGQIDKATAVGDIETAQALRRYAAQMGMDIGKLGQELDMRTADALKRQIMLTDEKDQRELEKAQASRMEALAQAQDQNALMNTWIDEALGLSSGMTTGLLGYIGRAVPNTDAFDLAALLNTIKANIGFSELQKMREASPTGGALGQVTVQELNFLQSVMGNLDQAQSRQQFETGLKRLKQALNDVVNRGVEAYNDEYGNVNYRPRTQVVPQTELPVLQEERPPGLTDDEWNEYQQLMQGL